MSEMTLNEYQQAAMKTATYQKGIQKLLAPLDAFIGTDRLKKDVSRVFGLLYTALGANGEAGEVADQAKRVLRDDAGELTSARKEKLIKELGDCLWYLAQAANELGVTLEEVAQQNIDKLAARAAANKLSGEGDNR